MPSLSPPASPTVGQLYTANGRTWSWTGAAWELTSGTGLSWSAVPASRTAAGTAGQIAYDGDYFYVATAENAWKRAALSAWSLDPNAANVSLLMHFDGNLTDFSLAERTVTAYGQAAATGAGQFGSNSLTLDGSGDYLSVPSSTDFDLGSSYTIECWIRPASGSWNGGILARGTYTSVDGAWSGLTFSMRRLSGDGFTRFYFYATTNTNEQYVDVSNTNFPVNQWTHLAMVRAGTTGTIYANGSSVGTISSLNANAASSAAVSIGRWPQVNENLSEFWNGQIDEVRITRNVALYSGASFTVPSAAFTNP